MSETFKFDYEKRIEQLERDLNETRAALLTASHHGDKLVERIEGLKQQRDQWREVARMFKESKVWNAQFGEAYAAFEALEKEHK